MTSDQVLRFWFEECRPDDWFARSDEFDRTVLERLGPAHETAAAGGFDGWRDRPLGCVALCILLDQVPRNLFRGTARAFATDARAQEIARHAVARGFDRAAEIMADHRLFLYLPFEHSEDLADQRLCLDLMRERIGNPLHVDYCRKHLEIIRRFGRFPHRNAALGRVSTPEEIEFLKQPGSSF